MLRDLTDDRVTRQFSQFPLRYYRTEVDCEFKLKTCVTVDFDAKRQRFRSRGLVCQSKKLNPRDHIPERFIR